jgi:type IV pilus assembly protein PilA
MQISRRRLLRRGFSLVELLIVIAIILIIAAIAVPKFQRTLMNARETAAVDTLRRIHQMQAQYYSTYGKFATNLTEMGPPTSGNAGPQAADLLPADLTSGKKGGYLYQMSGTTGGYQITAVPEVFNSTGSRTFYTDHTMVIRQNFSQEPANASSAPIG